MKVEWNTTWFQQHDLVSDVEFNSHNESRMERLLPETKHKNKETVEQTFEHILMYLSLFIIYELSSARRQHDV